MLARPSGPQIDENRCEITSTGVCARGRISTGTAPDAVNGAPCSVARSGADAALASSPRRLIMRLASPCITRPVVTSCTVFNLSRIVSSYCGRLAAIATTCDTITEASPPTSSVVTTTAPEHRRHLRAHQPAQLAHQRREQQAQEHGQRDRHQHLAAEIEQPQHDRAVDEAAGVELRRRRRGGRRAAGRHGGFRCESAIPPSLAPKA